MSRSLFVRLLALWVICLVVLPAQAARFHVRSTGTLTSGPSEAGSWTPDQCYATLSAAALAASPSDSLLLFSESHAVDVLVSLPAFLGNQGLNNEAPRTEIMLAREGGLTSSPSSSSLRLQGLTVTGEETDRLHPGLVLTDGEVDLALVGVRVIGLEMGTGDAPGGAALLVTAAGRIEAEDCYFRDNRSPGRGGAVHLGADLTARFIRCEFVGNEVVSGSMRGGAFYVGSLTSPSFLELLDCRLENNASGGPGGALSTRGAGVIVDGGVVYGNRSGVVNNWSEGAGLHFRRDEDEHTEPVSIEVRNVLFEANRGNFDPSLVAGDGGAVFTSGVADRFLPITVEDCVFRDNFNDQGSGVYVSRWSDGVVRRCRFYDNDAYHDGAGIMKGGHFLANRGETLTIDSCLFVNNRAGFDAQGQDTHSYARGGAICSRMRPRVVVRHCTFIDNKVNTSSYKFGDAFAHYFEEGAWGDDMLCVLQNCVFWGEDGNHVQAFCDEGGMLEVSNCATADGEMVTGGLPEIEPVMLDGVPFTSLRTGFPLADGPLIDMGADLGFIVDLDGRSMPTGDAPDIGCYEWHEVTPVQDTPTASPLLTAGPNPFNPRTVLSCRLPMAGQVAVVLHDARGHHVRTLWRGDLPAGAHQWTWNGKDDQGRDCATGIFLARLVLDGQTATVRKLTLVR